LSGNSIFGLVSQVLKDHSQGDHSEVIYHEFLIASCDAPEFLEPTYGAFDKVPFGTERVENAFINKGWKTAVETVSLRPGFRWVRLVTSYHWPQWSKEE